MRVYTSGVRMVDGLLGARLCLLAVFVFVCSISSVTAANNTIEEPIRHRPSSLTNAQLNSAVTIEFDFKHIDKTDRTAVKIAYRESRRKILEKLNRSRRTTTAATTEDLPFIDNDLELDENGILRISFFINTTEFSDDDLLEALNELRTDEDGFKEIAPVIGIYKGLPPVREAMADIQVWLPILFAIIVLIIIFIIVFCCWKATNKKLRDVHGTSEDSAKARFQTIAIE